MAEVDCSSPSFVKFLDSGGEFDAFSLESGCLDVYSTTSVPKNSGSWTAAAEVLLSGGSTAEEGGGGEALGVDEAAVESCLQSRLDEIVRRCFARTKREDDDDPVQITDQNEYLRQNESVDNNQLIRYSVINFYSAT